MEKQLKCEHCGRIFPESEKAHIITPYKTMPAKATCNKGACVQCITRKFSQHYISDFLEMSHVPKRFIRLMEDIKSPVEINPRQGLYLWGETGVGKTMAACCAARDFILINRKVSFVSVPKFIMELQANYSEAFNLLCEKIEEDVLVLDDLGVEKTTDYVRQSLYCLINDREQEEKLTIITSNYSLEELDSHIDGRISSRIAGMCKVVKLEGTDRRLGVKNQ